MKKKREYERENERENEERERERGELFVLKNVWEPSNPPDELAKKCFEKKKNPFRTNYSSIFLRKIRIWPFFSNLRDSNSIFRVERINSENVQRERQKKEVDFATLMDTCHLKNAELEPKLQKYKGRAS